MNGVGGPYLIRSGLLKTHRARRIAYIFGIICNPCLRLGPFLNLALDKMSKEWSLAAISVFFAFCFLLAMIAFLGGLPEASNGYSVE